MIRAIAAIDDKHGLAAHSSIPWHLPEDLRYFRDQTRDGVVLMGRRTAESLKHPLLNRRNVIASTTLTAPIPGFELVPDAVAFLQTAAQDNQNIWVIGGGELFASTLLLCDELYLTHVSGDFGCDTFFPEYANNFKQVSVSPMHNQNGHEFQFAVYQKY